MDRHAAFADLDLELANTRRVLERLPDDRFDFRPHEKSWTLAEMATHVASVPGWMVGMLTEPDIDLTGLARNEALPSREAVLERYDATAERVRAAWSTTDEEALAETWTVRYGDHIVAASPRSAMLRTTGLSHLVHHRGQLTLYLRLLDVPVPNLYGPTADER